VDASVLGRVRGNVQLPEDAPHVGFDGLLGDVESMRDAAIAPSLGDEREHLELPIGELRQWIIDDRRLDQLRNKRLIDDRAPLGDEPERVGQLLDVRDAVLQEIPDTFRLLAESFIA
jgi:hypothetical protein